ncbi:MAG: sulfur carrier protein ThiS [Lysobacterales bacterium]
MQITVNGEIKQFPEGSSVADLLQALGMTERRVAVEVNREIIPRSLHRHHPLQAGDRIELVQAIGGG